MRKRIVTTALILFLGLSFSVHADNPIKVIVNGFIVPTDTSPVISNDRVLVPIRTISESLGADVSWDNKTKTVNIVAKTSSALQDQVEALEKTYLPTSPVDAVSTWATGYRTKNGALQYLLFSDTLKEKVYSKFVASSWVAPIQRNLSPDVAIGLSSQIGNSTFEYSVKFRPETSKTEFKEFIVTVGASGSTWEIVSIVDKSTSKPLYE